MRYFLIQTDRKDRAWMQLLTAPVALDVDVIDLHILRLQLIDDRADIIHRVKLQIQIDVARVLLNVCIHDREQADAQKDHSKRDQHAFVKSRADRKAGAR